MITARLFQNSDNKYWGFEIEGHAGYAEEGEDIICSAVSVLALNTANSIEALTNVRPICTVKDGFLSCKIPVLREAKQNYSDVNLLLDSLALGLRSVSESYGTQYLHVLTIQK